MRDSLAHKISFCSLMAAIGVVFMLAANFIPLLTYISPFLAGFPLIAAVVRHGKKYAWMTWTVTAVLSMIICTDRSCAIFYLFIGYYPILKPDIEQLPTKLKQILAKLLLFVTVFELRFLLSTYISGLDEFSGRVWWMNPIYVTIFVAAMFAFDSSYRNAYNIFDGLLNKKASEK